jgi:hypothetical protein
MGGQVSVWVPMVVGALGILGVVTGQFVNAWRDDRQWKRTAHHDEWRHWRQLKMDVYANFAAALHNWWSTVGELMHHEASAERQAAIDRARASIDELAPMLNLIGSEKVAGQCAYIAAALSRRFKLVGEAAEFLETGSGSIDLFDDLGDKLAETMSNMRVELGIEPLRRSTLTWES